MPASGKAPSIAADTTPMMAQFIEIKSANADSLLFYRMGDFFELFFQDAIIASQTLGIQLTKRGKHNGEDIPMCGVPVKRSDEYLQKLIASGFKVAVCEQLEDPAEAKKRGAKAVVKRDVVRLVTPGTITEETLLDAHANNFLTAISLDPKASKKNDVGQVSIAALDISTGEFYVFETSLPDLSGELLGLAPKEILVSDNIFDDDHLRTAISITEAVLTPLPKTNFRAKAGKTALKSALGVLETDGFGQYSDGEWAAISAVLNYVELTQIDERPSINPPQHRHSSSQMQIDATTRVSLELVRSSRGTRADSLLATIDKTVTSEGARELAKAIATPSTEPDQINKKLDAVALFHEAPTLRQDIRSALRGTPDIARAISRLSLNRGGPRDLGAIRDGLQNTKELGRILQTALANEIAPPLLAIELLDSLNQTSVELLNQLMAALEVELPVHKKEGEYIKSGYLDELDEARTLRDQGRQYIADLQATYIEQTGIKTLKIKHNNVIGYFVEVTAGNADALQKEGLKTQFFHRQTLANAMRFNTDELSELEGKISEAAEKSQSLEQGIFADLVNAILTNQNSLRISAHAIGQIDHLSGLAELADVHRYTRPIIEKNGCFEIIGGRHPVVEQAINKSGDAEFIENDCFLNKPDVQLDHEGDDEPSEFDKNKHIWLLTGPNMAGKSTFLRQNALIVILAQMGSFVPARKARIGVVDRLFSRVGASDDLARGRSTFMVEMVETAGILNQATENSLVILDEIGRGTATYDGLAIAWATLEHLHNQNKCRALFATHYHEMTSLAQKLENITNATVEVREWRDTIIFLHRIRPGAADRSYGIAVARLAGLPEPVIKRALEVLQKLEADNKVNQSLESLADLPLFGQVEIEPAPENKPHPPLHPVLEEIEAVDLDNMTPREALEFLFSLKQK